MFYIALGALGAVGLLALLATGRVSPQNVLGLLIALSNAFGLIAGAPLLCWASCLFVQPTSKQLTTWEVILSHCSG